MKKAFSSGSPGFMAVCFKSFNSHPLLTAEGKINVASTVKALHCLEGICSVV